MVLIAYAMWTLPIKNTIPTYVALSMTVLFGWILELVYWLYQNEANGICSIWWDDKEVPWWTVSLFTILFQILFFLYLIQKYNSCQNLSIFEFSVISITFLPQLFCMTTLFLHVSVPLYYWLSKVVFTATMFGQVLYYYQISGLPLRRLTQEEINQLIPGKWFTRDLFVMFTLVHYVLCILADIFRLELFRVFTLSYLVSFMGDWCTSLIIVIGLSASFGFLSNLLIAMSRFLVTGEKAFAAAVFDVDIGGRVNTVMILFCLEAGIPTIDDNTRIQNLKYVLLLSFYIILAQVWDMTQQQCLIVANSGETRKLIAYLRVLLFAGIVTVIPTIVTIKVASYLQANVWLLLIATGNIAMLWRAFGTLVEMVLVTVAWHQESHLDKLEDVIYFVRLVKNLVTAVASLLPGYCRLLSPFFAGRFYFRIIIVVCEAVTMWRLLLYKELTGFQNRRRFLKTLDTIPDATVEQLQKLDDVCAICLAVMNEGKVLNCSHIFHKACLRKLFQTKTTCPVCNVAVF